MSFDPLQAPSARRRAGLVSALVLATFIVVAPATAQPAPELQALPSVEVAGYMGTWYQVAWFPNRFQKQCVSDTAATYRLLPDGDIEVLNRCRLADGRTDDVLGIARTDGSVIERGQLRPAQLRVSFLPAWLRWLPIWGRYWVIDRPADGRYAVISEPTREYLWVLSRTPTLSASDVSAIRSTVQRLGFDLARWQDHPQPNPYPNPAAVAR